MQILQTWKLIVTTLVNQINDDTLIYFIAYQKHNYASKTVASIITKQET